MSTIVSPYPSVDGRMVPRSASASWWRLRLEDVDGDGTFMVVRSDAQGNGMVGATWVSWEFFDGHNTMIDTGLDLPNAARITRRGTAYYVDVLYEGPPTPSERWRELTIPGDWMHPDDREAGEVEVLQG